jgi:hypothetical protein
MKTDEEKIAEKTIARVHTTIKCFFHFHIISRRF